MASSLVIDNLTSYLYARHATLTAPSNDIKTGRSFASEVSNIFFGSHYNFLKKIKFKTYEEGHLTATKQHNFISEECFTSRGTFLLLLFF